MSPDETAEGTGEPQPGAAKASPKQAAKASPKQAAKASAKQAAKASPKRAAKARRKPAAKAKPKAKPAKAAAAATVEATKTPAAAPQEFPGWRPGGGASDQPRAGAQTAQDFAGWQPTGGPASAGGAEEMAGAYAGWQPSGGQGEPPPTILDWSGAAGTGQGGDDAGSPSALQPFIDAYSKYQNALQDATASDETPARVGQAYEEYVQALQKAVPSDLQQRAIEAYNTYIRAVNAAFAAPDAPVAMARAYTEYVGTLWAAGNDKEASERVGQTYAEVTRAVQEAMLGQSTRDAREAAYQSFVAAVRDAWAASDPAALDPGVLVTVAELLRAAGFTASTLPAAPGTESSAAYQADSPAPAGASAPAGAFG